MKIVNTEEFNSLISENKYVVCDFFADWCMPCKMLAPILEDIANDYPEIVFCKVNVDNDEDLARQYRIDFIPNVNLFKDGVKVSSFSGLKQKDELKKIFDAFLE